MIKKTKLFKSVAARSEQAKAAISEAFTAASIRFKTQEHRDALFVDAVVTCQTTRVRLMLKNGANPNASDGLPLALAVSRRDKTLMNLLFDHGASASAGNETPLRVAVREGKVEMAQALIERGASFNDMVAHVKATGIASEMKTVEFFYSAHANALQQSAHRSKAKLALEHHRR